ncbi:MAG: 6-pyruvoyl tetrahydropterin synthase family protein [Pirellulales bacterium]|nr:6-pyruvoyl tetrahydropterin synthase family protein [Pirellulales bacterium]
MSADFRIRVTKDYLVFSAAHFITFSGNVCERLHGHNYRVAAEVVGPLDENHYVVDFIAVRDALQNIVSRLDHYTLLPTQHPQIRVNVDAQSVEVTFEERRWVFPRGDCVLLPLPNTTAEKLAEYIGRRLMDDLQIRLGKRPDEVCVEIDECQGQIGVCRLAGE